jgi:hypothetical protein
MPLAVNSFAVAVAAQYTKVRDFTTVTDPLNYKFVDTLATGTGANQADRLFHDQRTLAASANEDLDLAGSLLDAFGDTLTFARIKGIVVRAADGNTNNVVVGAAASNQFVGPFGAGTHTVAVRPGGVFAIYAPDATGYAVTAGTGDLLRIANSSSGTPVTYDIILIGASA